MPFSISKWVESILTHLGGLGNLQSYYFQGQQITLRLVDAQKVGSSSPRFLQDQVQEISYSKDTSNAYACVTATLTLEKQAQATWLEFDRYLLANYSQFLQVVTSDQGVVTQVAYQQYRQYLGFEKELAESTVKSQTDSSATTSAHSETNSTGKASALTDNVTSHSSHDATSESNQFSTSSFTNSPSSPNSPSSSDELSNLTHASKFGDSNDVGASSASDGFDDATASSASDASDALDALDDVATSSNSDTSDDSEDLPNSQASGSSAATEQAPLTIVQRNKLTQARAQEQGAFGQASGKRRKFFQSTRTAAEWEEDFGDYTREFTGFSYDDSYENKPYYTASGSFSWILSAIQFVGAVFGPVMPIMMGAVLLKICAYFLVWSGILTIQNTNAVYFLFFTASIAIWHFLPVFIAYTTARRLKADKLVAIALAIIILAPSWGDNGIVGQDLDLWGVTIHMYNYGNSVIPLIFLVCIQALVEKHVRNFLGKYLTPMYASFMIFAICVVLGFAVIGPVGQLVAHMVAVSFSFMYNELNWLPTLIYGTFHPFFVAVGLQYAFLPFSFIQITSMGADSMIIVGAFCSSMAIAASTWLIGLLNAKRNKKLAALARKGSFASFMGFSEPALFNVIFPKKYPLLAVLIAGGVGSFVGAMTKTGIYAPSLPGVPGLVFYIDDGLVAIRGILLAVTTSMLLSLVLTFILARFYEPGCVATEDSPDDEPPFYFRRGRDYPMSPEQQRQAKQTAYRVRNADFSYQAGVSGSQDGKPLRFNRSQQDASADFKQHYTSYNGYSADVIDQEASSHYNLHLDGNDESHLDSYDGTQGNHNGSMDHRDALGSRHAQNSFKYGQDNNLANPSSSTNSSDSANSTNGINGGSGATVSSSRGLSSTSGVTNDLANYDHANYDRRPCTNFTSMVPESDIDGLGRRFDKATPVYSPVAGRVRDLMVSRDLAIASGIQGQGVLLEVDSQQEWLTLLAPIDGTFAALLPTRNGLLFSDRYGNQLWLYFGATQVNLSNYRQAVQLFVSPGSYITLGQEVVRLNLTQLRQLAIPLHIIIICGNGEVAYSELSELALSHPKLDIRCKDGDRLLNLSGAV